MRWLIVIFFQVSAFHVSSQDSVQRIIHGIVTDANDLEPIAAANVFIKNHDHIGVSTDENGKFSLVIPVYIQDDFLTISSIGYETVMIDLNSIASEGGTIQFSLNRISILLDEVIIKSKHYDVEQICQQAIKKLSKNYPHKEHYIQGFYRKVSTDSIRYTGLVEAVIGIDDPGYKKSTEDIRIKALQTRHGDNLIRTDSVAFAVGNVLSERYGVAAAKSLHRFYESNLIRLYNKPYTLFNKDGRLFLFDDHADGITEKAEIENITYEDGDTILHIYSQSFSFKTKLDEIHVSINLRDNAIVEFTRGIFDDKVTVKFRRSAQGRYYPYFIRLVRPTLFDKNKGSRYYDIETFEVDFVDIDHHKARKAKSSEDRSATFSPNQASYDPEYWIRYMTDSPRPLDNDVLMSLERTRPLEEQFLEPDKITRDD